MQRAIALQKTICKWSCNKIKCIVHFTKKGWSATRLFSIIPTLFSIISKQTITSEGYSASRNRFRYTHYYKHIEKTNPIFKTWFVQLKIFSVQVISSGLVCHLPVFVPLLHCCRLFTCGSNYRNHCFWSKNPHRFPLVLVFVKRQHLIDIRRQQTIYTCFCKVVQIWCCVCKDFHHHTIQLFKKLN